MQAFFKIITTGKYIQPAVIIIIKKPVGKVEASVSFKPGLCSHVRKLNHSILNPGILEKNSFAMQCGNKISVKPSLS